MPQLLVLKTFKRTIHGRIRLFGIIKTEDGQVLKEVENQPTLKHLSRELRKGGLIPTSIQITKKCEIRYPI